MGVWFSRSSTEQNDYDNDNNILHHPHAFRYPPKSGTYFGSHFIMGGERFETPQPEQYLFGDNVDLNFLAAKPIPFPYPAPQSNEPSKCLKALINIRKETLRFVKVQKPSSSENSTTVETIETIVENENAVVSAESEDISSVPTAVVVTGSQPSNSPPPKPSIDNNPCYNIEFTFDCDCRCEITIHYACSEEVTPNGLVYRGKEGRESSEPLRFKCGANQVFSLSDHVVSPASFPENHKYYDPDKQVFPVVIHCRALEGHEPRQSHVTTATIEHHSSDGSYVLKPLKQKLFADGLVYLLQEVYGIENKRSTTISMDSKSNKSIARKQSASKHISIKTSSEAESGDEEEEQEEEEDEEDNNDSDDLEASSECVICMSDVRDTLILPCRHLCLCHSCADSLRYQANNCPICRAPFRALLQLRAVYRVPQTGPADATSTVSGSGQVTSSSELPPLLPMNTIPGYEMIPLLEALNGIYNGNSGNDSVNRNAQAAARALNVTTDHSENTPIPLSLLLSSPTPVDDIVSSSCSASGVGLVAAGANTAPTVVRIITEVLEAAKEAAVAASKNDPKALLKNETIAISDIKDGGACKMMMLQTFEDMPVDDSLQSDSNKSSDEQGISLQSSEKYFPYQTTTMITMASIDEFSDEEDHLPHGGAKSYSTTGLRRMGPTARDDDDHTWMVISDSAQSTPARQIGKCYSTEDEMRFQNPRGERASSAKSRSVSSLLAGKPVGTSNVGIGSMNHPSAYSARSSATDSFTSSSSSSSTKQLLPQIPPSGGSGNSNSNN